MTPKMTPTENGSFEREEAFHDRWADEIPVESVHVRAAFESFVALENRFFLSLFAPLAGRRVVDLGCGLGEAAVYFALQGADVTAVDISPGMVRRAQEVARHHGVEVRGVVTSLERLDLPAGAFDLAYGANVLHHAADIEAVLARVQCALKPGGTCFFWDPLAYNPAINVYRRMATSVRTSDEHPLRFSVLDVFRRHFVDVRHREFWLSTLALFLKYYFVDRLDPNQVRYWKRILEESSPSTERWFGRLARVDAVLLRLPPINRLAWNTAIWARKPTDGPPAGAL